MTAQLTGIEAMYLKPEVFRRFAELVDYPWIARIENMQGFLLNHTCETLREKAECLAQMTGDTADCWYGRIAKTVLYQYAQASDVHFYGAVVPANRRVDEDKLRDIVSRVRGIQVELAYAESYPLNQCRGTLGPFLHHDQSRIGTTYIIDPKLCNTTVECAMPGYAHIGIFAPMEEIVRAGVDNLVTHHMNYDKRILKEEALRSYAQSNLNNDFSEYEKKLRKDGELKRAVLPLYHKKHFVYASVTS